MNLQRVNPHLKNSDAPLLLVAAVVAMVATIVAVPLVLNVQDSKASAYSARK